MPKHHPVILLLIAILASCSMAGTAGDAEEGSLAITVRDGSARTLLPPIDMSIAVYGITGVGPGGRTFSRTSDDPSVTIEGLAFGPWTVTVQAMNADGIRIGEGTGSVVVHTGVQSTLAITVLPLPGDGSLALDVTWMAADVPMPSVDATLLPSTGPAIPLAFDVESGSATCACGGIAAGYYTLSVHLLDNGVLVMGAVEVVRIVEGQTTSGSFDFVDVNRGTGSVVVTISPVVSDPLAVTLTGHMATLAPGSTMTVSAAVPAGVGNVTYVWYLNAASAATGSNTAPSFTFGSALPVGYYRLDVTAFTADGLRAGAASHQFTVQ